MLSGTTTNTCGMGATDQSTVASLPLRRKEMGQYFTGLRVGRLLAHLAMEPSVRTVLDPMVGSGDLLEATREAAAECGAVLERLDGIELDAAIADVCRRRLDGTATQERTRIVSADAFDPAAVSALPERAYDLVITNPPYVRYQSKGNQLKAVRAGLAAVIAQRVAGHDARIWRVLANGYSGLADLSVPAWILAGALVRPGGKLALVAPATWRTRDYADVVRYLMAHCFSIETIVEDAGEAWFSDALVRTNLVVARRRHATEERTGTSQATWVRIGCEAANQDSLVGAAWPNGVPERALATWLLEGATSAKRGISTKIFDLTLERRNVVRGSSRRRWFQRLGHSGVDGTGSNGSLMGNGVVPESIADLLPKEVDGGPFCTLADMDISVGQGLRTGCNDFFYVTAREVGENETVIETAALFGRHRLRVPNAALRPVIRGQADLTSLDGARLPDARVLDLRCFVLPEDEDAVLAAQVAYAARGEEMPQTMPAALADHVRLGMRTRQREQGKLIPRLSAVATNVRRSAYGRLTPRFWYMLPRFAPRHLPIAFVPRVNHGLPWTECNLEPAVLVDANFATLWTSDSGWSASAIKALLNSSWCRAAMEALGTPMGGGALKLEATHLRNLPIPPLSGGDRVELDAIGKRLPRGDSSARVQADEVILNALLGGAPNPRRHLGLRTAIRERARMLSNSRLVSRRRVA